MTVGKRMVVVGGGIAGCVTALKLSKLENTVVDIYEKRSRLLNKLPYCHLHVAGALYPDLKIKECEKLFNESLAFAKEFARFMTMRPTIVAYKTSSIYEPSKLIFKLRAIRVLYSKTGSNIFGSVDDFFRVYTRDDMTYFKQHGKFASDKTVHSKYVENFCHVLKNVDDIKYPFVSVMEPGINQTELENNLARLISNRRNINVYTGRMVENINKRGEKWCVNGGEEYDFFINAMGHASSVWFPTHEKEYLEYKSSWLIDISRNTFSNDMMIPEIALIGERGTSNGMIQLTPIRMGEKTTFQVHYMSPDSSIIGMNTADSVTISETIKRTNRAIDQISLMFNIKKTEMECLNVALAGIQRTVSDSHSKRNSEVISYDNYVEIRLVKATGISCVSDTVVDRVSRYDTFSHL